MARNKAANFLERVSDLMIAIQCDDVIRKCRLLWVTYSTCLFTFLEWVLSGFVSSLFVVYAFGLYRVPYRDAKRHLPGELQRQVNLDNKMDARTKQRNRDTYHCVFEV